jgi:CBS domain containing-hemolysin-like protein
VGSAFAAADAALGPLTSARLSALEEGTGGAGRRAIARYRENRSVHHSRWLVGRVVFIAFAAVLVADAVAPHVPRWALAPVGALGALLTYGTITEVATTLSRSRADYFATHVLALMRPLELLVYPLAGPLSLLGRLATLWLGPVEQSDPRVTENEVEYVVTEGQKHGGLAPEPAEMIRNVLELKDLMARDVMVPRTRVCAIEAGSPLSEVLKFVASEGHSRYPVYREKIDNIIGLLYVKDLFRILKDGKLASTRLDDLVRSPVNFLPEVQGVSSVLREMRARRQHMAVVIDEFGGVSGIVTLEDILEVIVGDIRDEYDTEEAPIQDLGDGRLLADAAVSVHDLSAYLGAEIPGNADYESLGGLLVHQVGHVPAVGAKLDAFGMSFIVRDADEKRIAKVEIVRGGTIPPPSARASESPGDGGEAGADGSGERKVASAAT